MSQRSRPLMALTRGKLHRAFVSLPQSMADEDRPLQERTVFFEVPFSEHNAAKHLEALLAAAWCADTRDWSHDGFIYNVYTDVELLKGGLTGGDREDELRLLETGCGGDGPEATDPDRIHYARSGDVDLFVSPRVAARLRELLALADALRAAKVAARSTV